MLVAGVVIVGFIALQSFDRTTGAQSTPRPNTPRATPIPAWYDSGDDFRRYAADPTLAWKWLETNEGWAMMVTTRDGCSSLYVELSVTTDGGTVVGYTNDSVGAVPPRGEARLTFSNSSDGGSKARLTEISCL